MGIQKQEIYQIFQETAKDTLEKDPNLPILTHNLNKFKEHNEMMKGELHTHCHMYNDNNNFLMMLQY